MPSEDVTYTAKWIKVTVESEDTDKGTVSQLTSTYFPGDEATVTATTKAGYTFIGWYNGEEKLTDALTYTFEMPSEDVTYTAKWIKVSVESEDTDKGTVSQLTDTYLPGDEASITATTNLGYTFIGWYNGDEKVADSLTYEFTMPTENVTYTAKWKINPEMDPFVFSSTLTSLTITRVKTKDITYLNIPSYVTSIGNSAFKDCSGLTSIIIPNSVTSIGQGIFSGCSALEEITIPFVGAEAGKTSSDTYQYPFGYIFGTSSYTGGTAVKQYYYGSSTSSTTSTTYYIPSSLRSVTVTGGNILRGAFYNCSMLTSVTMPDSVTSIGYQAFYNCSGLTSITIGDSVTSIGDSAFKDCSSLTSIAIGDSVTSIGDSAFYGCGRLIEVYNKSSLNIVAGSSSYGYVGYYAKNVYTEEGGSWLNDTGDGFCFLYNGNTGYLVAYYGDETELTLPAGFTAYDGTEVTEYALNDYVFSESSGLISVTIGNNVTGIGSSAFKDCSSLTSIAIGNGVTSIGQYAFEDCSGLTSITIPDSVTSIGNYAFYGCSGLASVTIGNSVTSIGNYAFYNCSGLTSITIPDSVTSIGNYAFEGCSRLIEVYNKSSLNIIAGSSSYGYVGYYAKNVYTEEGGSWSTDTEDGFRFFYDGKQGYLIRYYGSETEIELPVSFMAYDETLIEKYVIYDYAFRYCSSLTSVIIPDSVTSIGSGAFSGCSALEEITIPFVGAEAGKTSSDTYQYPFGYIFGTSSYTGGTAVKQYYYGSSTSSTTSTTYYIPSSLRSVTVTGGNILRGAFYNCSMLTSVTMPDSVTSIGNYAFKDCSSLTSVTIPDSVTSIGDYAFYGCSSLEIMTIPFVGATKDGTNNRFNYIFGGGSVPVSLKEVIITGGTSIGYQAFYNCSGLTSITIPDSVTSIGDYAFYGCSGLISITIPDSVTSIGNSAFEGCRGLTSVTIPSRVTSIWHSAFSGCSGLTSVTFEETTKWYRISGGSTVGDPLSSSSLSDPSIAATWLRSTYCGYYWRRYI